jgi:hypothetical protein
MSTVYSTTTSFGGISLETGEHVEQGSGEVTTMQGTGGHVTEADFDAQYGDYTAPGTVTRNGSSVTINNMSELQGDDLVKVSDGGQEIEVSIDTLKGMGLMHLVESHIYGEDPAEEYDQLQEMDRLGDELTATPDQMVRSNLDEAVQSGDISDRVHTAANLLYDTGQMLGASAQDTLDYAMNALDTGDYSQIAALGVDEGTARATIETAYGALEAEATNEIGQIGMVELERAATLFPEVRSALMQVGAGVLSGQMGKGAWTSLHNQIMKTYGQRLNAIR